MENGWLMKWFVYRVDGIERYVMLATRRGLRNRGVTLGEIGDVFEQNCSCTVSPYLSKVFVGHCAIISM